MSDGAYIFGCDHKSIRREFSDLKAVDDFAGCAVIVVCKIHDASLFQFGSDKIRPLPA